MEFEWDDAKNRANIRKHHIDFVDVSSVFDRPMLVSADDREQYGEDRWIAIGVFPNGVEVVVVFTEPASDTTRIISARRATREERKRYHEAIGY